MQNTESQPIPSAEALEAAAAIVDLMGETIGPDKVIWPETWRRCMARALDRFRAAGVEAERERCLWWVRAFAAYPQSNPAAREIRAGAPAGRPTVS